MIVPNDIPASPTKSSQRDNPPAYQYTGYTTTPAGTSTQLPPTLPTARTPILIKDRRNNASSAACRRFSKAFFVAVLIYFLAAAFFGSISWGRNLEGGDWQYWGDGEPEWPEYTNGHGWDIARDGCSISWNDPGDSLAFGRISLPGVEIDLPEDAPEIIIDPNRANAPYHSRTTLTLSPEAARHLIVGNRAYGDIEFDTSSDVHEIKVTVIASYYRQFVFDKVRVCKLHDGNGGEGVGIYMPLRRGSWRQEDHVSFKVMVTFPTSSPRLVINSLETSLSIFSHHLHELKNKVFFRNLKLRSSNAHLRADSVEAAQTDLRTSNGAISGKYYVNNTLTLDTSNGRIDVDLELEDEGRKSEGVEVTLRSSNAPIQAVARLYSRIGDDVNSPFKSDKGGRFTVSAKTSNGHLTLNVPTIPFEAILKLTGRTSNSPIDVHLDKKGSFEGFYKASTSSYMGIPTVERADFERGSSVDVRRVLETNHAGRGINEGRVYLDSWKNNGGFVDAGTSNAKAYLSI